MNRLSNRGQSLVIFIVFIPLMIMIGTLIIDVGYAEYNKIKLNELTKMIINYGMRHINEDPYDQMVTLINKNDNEIDDYDIKIDNDNKTINVSINKTTKGFFGSIIGKEFYKEKCSYTAILQDEKIIIMEDKK